MDLHVGFTCAYTPLALFEAAGLVPYRLLPQGEAPERAGEILHDNLCAHVKRVLDRALAGELPPLAGVVLVNSCDAMRRLADAWRRARPEVPALLLDLPVAVTPVAAAYLALELRRLATALEAWGGSAVSDDALEQHLARWDRLATQLERAQALLRDGQFPGGAAALQAYYNQAACQPAAHTLQQLEQALAAVEVEGAGRDRAGVPVFIFGNVLADPEAIALIETCGARVAGEDLCTGSRLAARLGGADGAEPWSRLAAGLLARPPCARTIQPEQPEALARHVVDRAQAAGVRGVIGHVLKFCDPYLVRMPALRSALHRAGLPLLLLEGDCTLRSVGQQRTRIEAFVETLG